MMRNWSAKRVRPMPWENVRNIFRWHLNRWRCSVYLLYLLVFGDAKWTIVTCLAHEKTGNQTDYANICGRWLGVTVVILPVFGLFICSRDVRCDICRFLSPSFYVTVWLWFYFSVFCVVLCVVLAVSFFHRFKVLFILIPHSKWVVYHSVCYCPSANSKRVCSVIQIVICSPYA